VENSAIKHWTVTIGWTTPTKEDTLLNNWQQWCLNPTMSLKTLNGLLIVQPTHTLLKTLENLNIQARFQQHDTIAMGVEQHLP
jgi:hypothetical protein